MEVWPEPNGLLLVPPVLSSQVSFFLFIIFIVYTMLPVCMQDAVGAGLICSLSHIIVLAVYLSTSQGSQSDLALQVSLTLPGPDFRHETQTGVVSLALLAHSSPL